MSERVVPYSYGGPGCDPDGGHPTCDPAICKCDMDLYEYGEKVLAEAKSDASTPRERLYGAHRDLCRKAKALMELKNRDYATTGDPYRNFHTFGGLGILVRLSDKLARLRSWEEKGEYSVKDEGLLDTILDTINYAVIYYAYKQEQAAK